MLQLESGWKPAYLLLECENHRKSLGNTGEHGRPRYRRHEGVLPCTNTKAAQQNKASPSETGDADTSQKDYMVATAQGQFSNLTFLMSSTAPALPVPVPLNFTERAHTPKGYYRHHVAVARRRDSKKA